MAWELIGSAAIGPAMRRVVLGGITVPQVGGLALKVGSVSPAPFQFGYCLLSFESSYGREMGTIRVWPRSEMTVYRLGDGVRVRDPGGVLVLEPRTWNLRWIDAGFPLSVAVLADLPSAGVDGGVPAPGFIGPGGTALPLTPAGESGRLTFSP